MYFWIYGIRKTWLDKSLRSLVSADNSRSNMVTGLKYCSKLNDSSFTIFIDTSEGNSGSESLSQWYVKSQDSLLTHSLPIISILLKRGNLLQHFPMELSRKGKTFYCNIFFFFFTFSKFKLDFEHLQRKATLTADVFLNLRTPANVVR